MCKKERKRKNKSRRGTAGVKARRNISAKVKACHDKLTKHVAAKSTSAEKASDKKRKSKKLPKFNLKGNRIVNLAHFGKEFDRVMYHRNHCPFSSNAKMDREIRRDGLVAVSSFECLECGVCINAETQPTSEKIKGTKQHCINVAAVWGSMSTGGGYANLHESLSVLEVPIMQENVYAKAPNFIGEQ